MHHPIYYFVLNDCWYMYMYYTYTYIIRTYFDYTVVLPTEIYTLQCYADKQTT